MAEETRQPEGNQPSQQTQQSHDNNVQADQQPSDARQPVSGPSQPAGPQYQPVQAKKSGGCRKSCLIISLVLIIVFVGGGVAAFFFGRAYLNRQIVRWEDQYPMFSTVRDLLGMRGALEPGDNRIEFGGDKQEGVNDKALLPQDIPMYDDAMVETYSIGDGQGVGFQRLQRSFDDVQDFLAQEMVSEGWSLASEQEFTDSHLLIWQKGDIVCQTEIVGYEDYTEIWLRYSSSESGQE